MKTMRWFFNCLLLTTIVLSLLGRSYQPSYAQTSGPDVQSYLNPGEEASPMITVFANGTSYYLYLISSKNFKSLQEEVFYNKDKEYWDSHSINAVLAFDMNNQLVVDESLLREIFLAQLGGCIMNKGEIYYRFVPSDASMIDEMTRKTSEPLFIYAFAQQEIKSLLQHKSQSDLYLEALRSMMASNDQIAKDFARDVADETKNSFGDWSTAIEDVMKMEKYANDKDIRESAKKALKEFGAWKKTTSPGAIQYKINNVDTSFANWIDLGSLAINLIYMQEMSSERTQLLRDLLSDAQAQYIQLSPDLQLAIKNVIAEADNSALQGVNIVLDFVTEHAADLAVDVSQDMFRDMVTKFIWAHYGTRYVGHIIAGAFASVFIAYDIANILFGLDSVYENFVTMENAAKISLEIRQVLLNFNPPTSQSLASYSPLSDVFRRLTVLYNYSLAQSFRSRAITIYSARLLKVIQDLFSGNQWDQAAKGFEKYALDGEQAANNILLHPEIIDYAVTLPAKRVHTIDPTTNSSSTVLLMDASGSMNEEDESGMMKIDAAKRAVGQILDIISTETQSGQVTDTQAGLISFNISTDVVSALTTDISAVRSSVENLYANNGTGMPDGLRAAIDQFPQGGAATRQMIILLSDGMPNVALGGDQFAGEDVVRQQVLDLAGEAGQKGICIYTIGLGIPGTTGGVSGENSIDKDFLT